MVPSLSLPRFSSFYFLGFYHHYYNLQIFLLFFKRVWVLSGTFTFRKLDTFCRLSRILVTVNVYNIRIFGSLLTTGGNSVSLLRLHGIDSFSVFPPYIRLLTKKKDPFLSPSFSVGITLFQKRPVLSFLSSIHSFNLEVSRYWPFQNYLRHVQFVLVKTIIIFCKSWLTFKFNETIV